MQCLMTNRVLVIYFRRHHASPYLGEALLKELKARPFT